MGAALLGSGFQGTTLRTACPGTKSPMTFGKRGLLIYRAGAYGLDFIVSEILDLNGR